MAHVDKGTRALDGVTSDHKGDRGSGRRCSDSAQTQLRLSSDSAQTQLRLSSDSAQTQLRLSSDSAFKLMAKFENREPKRFMNQ